MCCKQIIIRAKNQLGINIQASVPEVFHKQNPCRQVSLEDRKYLHQHVKIHKQEKNQDYLN